MAGNSEKSPSRSASQEADQDEFVFLDDASKEMSFHEADFMAAGGDDDEAEFKETDMKGQSFERWDTFRSTLHAMYPDELKLQKSTSEQTAKIKSASHRSSRADLLQKRRSSLITADTEVLHREMEHISRIQECVDGEEADNVRMKSGLIRKMWRFWRCYS